MKRLILRLLLSFILGAASVSSAFERSEIRFDPIPTVEKSASLHLELQITNFSSIPVQEVQVYYRAVGDARFKSKYLKPEGLRYGADLNLSNIKENLIEYYFEIEYTDGTYQSYPSEAPEANLLNTVIRQTYEGEDNIIILSPEPDEEILTDEIVISVSFPKFSGQVDPERTHLYIDTWEVSRYLTVYEDFLTFAPRQVPAGKHTIRLELFDKEGKLLVSRKWSFTAHRRRGPRPVGKELTLSGQFYAEHRQEDLFDGEQSTTYNRVGLNLTASSSSISFGTNIFVSNQEKDSLQPVNRFSGFLHLNFWNNRYLRITGGDVYPQLDPFLLQNVFVRGGHIQLYLKFINIDALAGVTQRAIEGNRIITQNPPSGIPDTTIIPGTFRRKIYAIRPSFGARNKFQFGLTFMKGKDEENSINLGQNPQENVGVGANLFLAFDKQRIILEGNISASSFNSNISGGSIPFDTLQKRIEGLEDSHERYYNLAKKIITVNENLIIRPGIAYQALLRLHYLNNSISAIYQYVEDDFFSLGQPYLLRDHRGFSITDNIRLFKNQLFLNIGYRNYENNLQNNKPATTDNKTLFVNVSYFPMGNFPSLTFGYNNYTRDNGLTIDDVARATPEDNESNTLSFSSSYRFYTGTMQHRLILSLMNYRRNDNIFDTGDNSSNSLSFRLQTRYRFPLKTFVEVMAQQSDNARDSAIESNLELTSLGGGFEYNWNRLFGKSDALLFSFHARYGTISNTVPGVSSAVDYNRLFLNGRIIYVVPRLGRLSINTDLVQYSGDLDFQDFIFTARYDVNF